uniref:Uncharacterized protein n=1 Tax=Setaria viridis TaxID=4556 RepID=A0A4U6U523_SETVI|nr:hypothetical protein SEVIR_6G186750v2 [Setaria viridis]
MFFLYVLVSIRLLLKMLNVDDRALILEYVYG